MRFAIRAASQLPGRGATVVDIALYLHVNKKSDDDDLRGSNSDLMLFASLLSWAQCLKEENAPV